jgi:glutathione S-transferase
MLTIHDYKGFPNPLRVRIAVAEKGLEDRVRYETVDVPNGAHRTREFLAKNPAGAVPVLELEDGTFISESAVIIAYLDALEGEPTLTGRTPRERAVIGVADVRAQADLLDAVGTYFHHATPGLGPTVELYQNPDWGQRQRLRAIAAMRRFDTVLASQPWLAGEAFSSADITAYAGLVFADFAKIDVPEDCCNLTAWRARVAARPSVANQ